MKRTGPAEKTQPVDARMKLKRLNAKESHSLNSPCQVLQTPDANSTASPQYARSLAPFDQRVSLNRMKQARSTDAKKRIHFFRTPNGIPTASKSWRSKGIPHCFIESIRCTVAFRTLA